MKKFLIIFVTTTQFNFHTKVAFVATDCNSHRIDSSARTSAVANKPRDVLYQDYYLRQGGYIFIDVNVFVC